MLSQFKVRERGHAAAQKATMRITQPSSWKLPKQSSSIAPPDVWTNADMDPVPPERRTWGRGAFVTYWVSDLITISTWSSGSAIITLGRYPFLRLHVPLLTRHSQVLLQPTLSSLRWSQGYAMRFPLCSMAPLVPTCISRSPSLLELAMAIGSVTLLLSVEES
jgi:hypothetical protein